MICHNQIAECTFFLINRESFTTQSDFCVVLSARIYFQFNHSVYGLDVHSTSKNSCIKVYIDISEQVVAFTFELWVRSNLECDVKVSVRCSIAAFFAVAFQFYHLSVGNTGRYGYTQVLAVHAESLFVRNGCIAE